MVATAYSIEGSTPSGAGGERRTGLLVFGIVLLVVGLMVGIGLLAAAAQRLDDQVAGLARAPVGCTTTLNFSQTGDFLIFVESESLLDDVRGDCDVSGRFVFTGDEPPAVSLSMVDPDGADLDLRLQGGTDYEADGFVGRSERVVTITNTGDHLLTVASDASSTESQFGAVAVGKDPNSGVALLRIGAVLAGLTGLVAGIACIVLGSRRRPATTTDQTAGWPGAAGWPPSTPGAQPPGAQFPPTGPPQSWPTQPPTAQPPVSRPPGGQPPGSWPGVSDPAVPRSPAPSQPEGLSGPAWTSRSTDGSTGDGERSPWAPPQEE